MESNDDIIQQKIQYLRNEIEANLEESIRNGSDAISLSELIDIYCYILRSQCELPENVSCFITILRTDFGINIDTGDEEALNNFLIAVNEANRKRREENLGYLENKPFESMDTIEVERLLQYMQREREYIAGNLDNIERKLGYIGNSSKPLESMTGVEFERLVESLLSKMGLEINSTKATADGGIDLIAYSDQAFFKGKYIIQCKRWNNNIGEPVIRDLYGVIMSERANKGILITNSSFTSSAIDFARDKPIELIDGQKLNALLSEYGLVDNSYIAEDIQNEEDNIYFEEDNELFYIEGVRKWGDRSEKAIGGMEKEGKCS